ncbi:MAG: hypothetical protein HYR60_02725 [Acidobacteria bacterium]|nr:hypothetical protein [Acidobacteriota bacterium]
MQVIQIKFEDGRIVCDPKHARANPGEQVVWMSTEGKFAVSFPEVDDAGNQKSPMTESANRQFKGGRHTNAEVKRVRTAAATRGISRRAAAEAVPAMTDVARVRPDASGTFKYSVALRKGTEVHIVDPDIQVPRR